MVDLNYLSINRSVVYDYWDYRSARYNDNKQLIHQRRSQNNIQQHKFKLTIWVIKCYKKRLKQSSLRCINFK